MVTIFKVTTSLSAFGHLPFFWLITAVKISIRKCVLCVLLYFMAILTKFYFFKNDLSAVFWCCFISKLFIVVCKIIDNSKCFQKPIYIYLFIFLMEFHSDRTNSGLKIFFNLLSDRHTVKSGLQ